ncbi:aldo/keto reductase [Fertoebacter nigrum]|uniref:Aldo/keto reductase n=1 Tax=Fertoeibacter niger TaxID=2656921 RepID=A0A8X8H104_9RHOB|nr:aldo/keto reductase [Fertoeibacter niger]NUB45568.1 aldo/keto reductase [Fertoeibacter niger]
MTGMLKREIGETGIMASAVGLGTWAIGGWMWGGTDDAAAEDAIRAGLDAGITLIDTAPAYGLGHAEAVVGRAMKGRRDQVVLATKCGLVWHTQRGPYFFSQGGLPVHRDLSAAAIRHEVEQSLTRLNTDRIDLYITHWQDPTTPVAETVAALKDLQREGKILAFAASNTTPDHLAAYRAEGGIAAVQEEYSMVERRIEQTHLLACRDAGIAVMGYSVLALGLLSGRIGADRVFAGDDQRQGNPRFSPENRGRVDRVMQVVRPIAADQGASPAQVVIAWTLAQPGLTFALCGARNAQQARENAEAGQLHLAPAEIDAITVAARTHLEPATT